MWAELERRLGAFLGSLPPAVREIGLRQSAYTGRPGDEAFTGIGPLNPVLVGTPWHFGEIFAALPEGEFLGLAEAGALHVLASVVADHLVDDQVERHGASVLLHQALIDGAFVRFRDLMGPDADFWSRFDSLSARHLKALAEEIEIQQSRRAVSESSLEAMAAGKVAPIVVTVTALAHRARRVDILPGLEDSLAKIAAASQLLDDVIDWRQDLARHHWTHFLARFPSEGWAASESWPTEEWIEERMRAGWQDVDALTRAGDWMAQSLAALGDLACPAWRDYVEGYSLLTTSHLNYAVAGHLREAVGAVLQASAPPSQASAV
ncbi:MAG: hypothetical protein ACRDHY_14445 [Anaerolineales bacterium]